MDEEELGSWSSEVDSFGYLEQEKLMGFCGESYVLSRIRAQRIENVV